MMSCAKGRPLLVKLLIVVSVCRCSPVPASGPGIEIQPAEFVVDGQPSYILVGDKGGAMMENQTPPNKQPVLANPESQYQQQPQHQELQYYQPQYHHPQYQHHQYQQPHESASYSGQVEIPPGHYHPYEYRPSYIGSPGLTSFTSPIGGHFVRPSVFRPSLGRVALLGAATRLFG